MIKLRSLSVSDAPLMLEWMQDESIASVFNIDMAKMRLEDAKEFCIRASDGDRKCLKDGGVLHFAIADTEADEYLGTISLKNVNLSNNSAEYAISTRRKVHGTGVAMSATKILLKKGFEEYRFHRIYLNVLETNCRAVAFYKKCGFQFEGKSRDAIFKEGKFVNLMWFSMLEKEYSNYKKNLMEALE